MNIRTIATLLLAALAAALACGPAQAFPDKHITLIVPYPPGGATDVLGRILAKGLSQRLGREVIIDNKAGAGTAIGATALAQAPADGHTLLFSSNTTFTLNPALRKLAYDPLKNFESIGLVGTSPLVLLANNALPANSVKELVALAKARPGKLNYGSFGGGTSSHFAGEMFKLAAGVDIVHVPYKGSAPAMTDLIGGQVNYTFDTSVAALPMLQAGKVKALAVTSPKRTRSLPGVPSIAEMGYPGYEMVPWLAVVAPRGLPPAVHKALSKALADTLADPAIHASLERAGIDPAYRPGSDYDSKVEAELPLLRAYVHKAKIQAD